MAQRNAAKVARVLARNGTPLVIESEVDLGFMPPFAFPDLGVEGCAGVDASPRMERLHTYGAELALSPGQVLARLRLLVVDGPIAVAHQGDDIAVWRLC